MTNKEYDISAPTLFYGAGERSGGWVKLLSERFSLYPTCFIDKDTSKQGTELFGKPILSLKIAVESYPDCNIFISTSQEKWEQIIEELVTTALVKREQILNFELFKEYRSCFYIEHSVAFHNKSIAFCISRGSSVPQFATDFTDCSHIPQQLLNLRKQTIKTLNSGIPTSLPCENCDQLRKDIWLSGGSGELRFVEVSGSWTEKVGVCSMDCIYCRADYKKAERILFENVVENSIISYSENMILNSKISYVVDFLNTLEKDNLLDAAVTPVRVIFGEITVTPGGNELLNVLSKKYNLHVLTNAGVFSDELAAALTNPRSKMIVSLDSGTAETFYKIKRRNVFEKVCKNLHQYCQFGNVELKYIVLSSINDNVSDMDGFVEICKDLGIATAYISADKRERLAGNRLPFETINAINYMIKSLKSIGVQVLCWNEFTSGDLELIDFN